MTDQAKKQDASMDEILSSIRSIVNEEMDKKSGQVDGDVLELTEEIDHDVPTADLGVTSAIADAPDHKVEDDLIDINAFSEDGVIKPADEETVAEARHHYDPETPESADAETASEEVVDEAAAALDELNAVEESAPEASAEDMAAEMMGAVAEEPSEVAETTEGEDVTDAMAAAVEAMSEEPEVAVEDVAEDVMSEEPVETTESATLSDADMDALMSEETATEEVVDDASMNVDGDDLSSAATETLIQQAVAASEKEESVIEQKASEFSAPTERVNLKAIPSANSSLQIGFPLEVLAEALRPLVKDWVEENLQEVVERLVREEIQKMTSRS